MLNAGTFPVAPIIVRRPEGLSPIDGSHRLAVFSALQLMPEKKFAALRLAKPALERMDRYSQERRVSERPVE